VVQIPKAQKDTENLSDFFLLLGSALVKAAHKMLMKLTPSVNFINILQRLFAPKNYKSKG